MLINAENILLMIADWMETPVNSFFGSNYGCDLASLLLHEQTSDAADEFIAKMKRDLPVLSQLPPNMFSIYAVDEGFEQKILYLSVGDVSINLNKINASRAISKTGDTYNVDAS